MVARFALLLALLSAATGIAAPPVIAHDALACVTGQANPKITAHITGTPTAVRVYFHANNMKCAGEYYVEMRRSEPDPTLFTAILPLLGPDADGLVYQIRVQSAGANEVLSPVITVPIRAGCATPAMTPLDVQAAKAIAVGLTQQTQKTAPCAFKCNGITHVITASGELKPNDECRLILAAAGNAAGKPWYETGKGAAVLGGAAALGAGVYIDQHGRDNRPPSPARP